MGKEQGHLVLVNAVEADESGLWQEGTHGTGQVIGNVMAVAELEGDCLAVNRRSIADARDAQVHQEALCYPFDLIPQQTLPPHADIQRVPILLMHVTVTRLISCSKVRMRLTALQKVPHCALTV